MPEARSHRDSADPSTPPVNASQSGLPPREQTPAEEIANSVTHGIGFVLSIAGLAILVGFAARFGTAWHIVSCSVFGAALVFQYATSTLYHGVWHPPTKRTLRVFDHCAIFILIAGSYTPFALVNLRSNGGWILFGVIWGLAVIGIVTRLGPILGAEKHEWLRLALYLAMGWTAVAAIVPMLRNVAPGGLILLALGGLAYTGGVVFYRRHKMQYHHAVWHGFVLGGSTCHFFAVLFYVIPIGS